MNGITTFALVGGGGQGVLLAAAVLAETALAEGLDVKASEVKGMAQRGGTVLSMVRFGDRVWSPVSPHADLVLAMELLEGRRALELLAPRGSLVCASTRLLPGSVLRGEATYPEDLDQAAAALGARLLVVDAEALAAEAGTARAANVALLGAASTVLPFAPESWRRGLATLPEKIVEVNQRAFDLARAWAGREEARS
jgi:indolepyruvate ferredoxin oxidoreductase, beta subunit